MGCAEGNLVLALASLLAWCATTALLGLMAFMFVWHGAAAWFRYVRRPRGQHRVVFGPGGS